MRIIDKFIDTILNFVDRNALYKENEIYSNNKFENSILYCTLSPCKDCIKIIAAAKINTVIYHTKYRDFDLVQNLANTFNIELILFHENL